jgi:hypothetical protein
MKDLAPIERRIITAMIDAALAKQWRISVYDGEEYTVTASTDRKAIRDAIGTTDEGSLKFSSPQGEGRYKIEGIIFLVHGNHEDVICDCTDNDAMIALCAIGNAAAEWPHIKLEGKIGGFQ